MSTKWRFSIIERNTHHATGGAILILAEKLVPGDKMTVEKEIGTGYHVTTDEAPRPKPSTEYEG